MLLSELVSVQDAIYGPKNGSTNPGFSGISGLGVGMTQAESTSGKDSYSTGYTTSGYWDFTSLTNLNLLIVVDGTNAPLIDNVVQTVDLADLEGLVNTTAAIVNEINSQITDGTIVGGFYAVGGGVSTGPTIDGITLSLAAHPLKNANNLTIATLSHGRGALKS